MAAVEHTTKVAWARPVVLAGREAAAVLLARLGQVT
jgi:hypothetical protein